MSEKQTGTVLVFKKGVSKEEVKERLKALNDILDSGYYLRGQPTVREFNPDWGGPVWYIP
jgi:hypothetical protein